MRDVLITTISMVIIAEIFLRIERKEDERDKRKLEKWKEEMRNRNIQG